MLLLLLLFAKGGTGTVAGHPWVRLGRGGAGSGGGVTNTTGSSSRRMTIVVIMMTNKKKVGVFRDGLFSGDIV
jgi:hypothetical protein